MKYVVTITQTLCKHIILEAESPDEAEDLALSAYTNCYIEPPDYVVDTSFECTSEAAEVECMYYEHLKGENA